MRDITDEEYKILSHGIAEVDSWLLRTNGSEYESEIGRLIEKFRPLYEAEIKNPDYKTAAEKADIELQKFLQLAPAKSMDEIIAEKVQEELTKRGYTDTKPITVG